MIEAGQGTCDEFVLACCAGRLDGGDDATACPGDLLVARALQTQLEFMSPVAAMDQMSVAIDKAGGDPATLAVDPLDGIPAGREILCRPSKGDAAILGGNGSALDDPEIVVAKRSKASVEPDPVEAHVPAPVRLR